MPVPERVPPRLAPAAPRRPVARALAALALAAALAPGAARAADRAFAVVVGWNASDEADLAPLRYADDDALRYGELLGSVVDEATVLTALDEESRALWGDVAVAAPTRAAVIGALGRVHRQMEAARAAGDRPVLWFVYSGHGNYDVEGRGYVHLADGRFTTRDLYHHVIEPSADAPVVLLVDACNAALLVRSRGAPERRPAGPSTLELERYPNVGVILASSSVAEVHEWGRYLAGIFSHEVRSALLGPGDLDDDGRVTFGELAAFVAAANARVTNPAVRLTPYIRPPLSEPDLPLVDLAKARFPARIRIPASLAGKAHLVDEDLVRHADFHKPAGTALWLALPRAGAYVLVHGDQEHLVPAGTAGAVDLDGLERRERTVLSARGAGSDYFDRTLFHEALDEGFARRYLEGRWLRDLEVRRLVREPWYRNPPAWATLAGGAALLGGATALQVSALREEERARETPWGSDRAAANDRIDRQQTGAWALYGVGGAAAVGGALWLALDRPAAEQVWTPPLRVKVGPRGVQVSRDF